VPLGPRASTTVSLLKSLARLGFVIPSFLPETLQHIAADPTQPPQEHQNFAFTHPKPAAMSRRTLVCLALCALACLSLAEASRGELGCRGACSLANSSVTVQHAADSLLRTHTMN
jgi:hypothetical protein